MAESAKRIWSPDELEPSLGDSLAKKACLVPALENDADAPIEIPVAATAEVTTSEVSSLEASTLDDSIVDLSTPDVSTGDGFIADVSTNDVSTAELSVETPNDESSMDLTIDLTKPLDLSTRPPRRKASMVNKQQKVVKKVMLSFL